MNTVSNLHSFLVHCESAEKHALVVFTHLNCSLRFNKPSAQHGLHVSITQVLVGLQNLTLGHLLQQEPTEAPVEKGPCIFPVQNILWKKIR